MIPPIPTNRISPSFQASGKKEALLELAALLHRNCPQLAENEIFATLQEREKIGSTGIGEGIAIPHGKMEGIEQIEICFARSLTGIPFEAGDNKPVHLFFALLAPKDSAKPYLNTLGSLARFLKSPHIRSRLLNAEGAEEIADIFASTGKFS